MAGPAASIVTLYRLFWSRVEYVLGKSDTWTSCPDAIAKLEAEKTNTAEGLGGLCGSTSVGRDATPPEQLPRLAEAPAPPSKHSKQSKGR